MIYKAQRLSSPRIFRVQLLHAILCDYVHYLFKMVMYGHFTGRESCMILYGYGNKNWHMNQYRGRFPEEKNCLLLDVVQIN